MSPTPGDEDVDFPALMDKIRELLHALWAFVSNLCISLWSHISQAFWAVWTYPPFETFRNELISTLIVLKDYVVAHPIASAVIAVLASIVVLVVWNVLRILLRCMGFEKQGMLRDSYAVNYQSTGYGGNVPNSSMFARSQSQGARAPSWD